jgi:hypothetical protein
MSHIQNKNYSPPKTIIPARRNSNTVTYHHTHLNVECVLQRLVCVVDEQLFELVAQEVLEAEDVQHADELLRVG